MRDLFSLRITTQKELMDVIMGNHDTVSGSSSVVHDVKTARLPGYKNTRIVCSLCSTG